MVTHDSHIASHFPIAGENYQKMLNIVSVAVKNCEQNREIIFETSPY